MDRNRESGIEIIRHRSFQLWYLAVVIIPNLVGLAVMIGIQIPGGFVTLVCLSVYYMLIELIFGKTLFLTETVIMPLNVVGIWVTATTYSVPFALWWIFVYFTKSNH